MAPHEMTRNTRGLHSGERTENAAMSDFRFKGHPTGREAATRNLATADHSRTLSSATMNVRSSQKLPIRPTLVDSQLCATISAIRWVSIPF